MDNFDLRKYLAEGRLFEEKGFNIGDKRTIEITDPNGNKSENLVVVIPSPKGKEEDDIVWVVFLDGEFKGKISSYEKKFIAEGRLFESFNVDIFKKTYEGDEDLNDDYDDFYKALDEIVFDVPNTIWDGERVFENSYLIYDNESKGLTGWEIIQKMVSALEYRSWYDDIDEEISEKYPDLDEDEIRDLGEKMIDDIQENLKVFGKKYNLSDPVFIYGTY